MTSHIGIVAVSPEGASLCHRQIFRHASALLEPHAHPVVSMHNLPLADYVDAVRAGDWHAVGALLRQSADVLASCGASFCFTPDNAVQHGVHLARVGSPIPWLDMTDIVAGAVEDDGRTTVGILGTSVVTRGFGRGGTRGCPCSHRKTERSLRSTLGGHRLAHGPLREDVAGVVHRDRRRGGVDDQGRLGTAKDDRVAPALEEPFEHTGHHGARALGDATVREVRVDHLVERIDVLIARGDGLDAA